ncbi:hypothetical protein TorRG33x02_119640 [Trema orientale]|uniref:Uncharacterized protein n=1 Tax=Trema orientale TaxID=63057 RepID=A0A2P5F2X6_TREOI|nr:hypothetical protein TorRG33x02_119640 [Trema orientale]
MELILPKCGPQGLLPLGASTQSFLSSGLGAARPRGSELRVSFMGLKVDIRFKLLPLWK